MNREELRSLILRTLGTIAPEADLAQLKANVSLREQLDIDSMDFLNFVIALHEELKLEIPERDYAKLMTLDGCTNYLASSCDARKVPLPD